MRASASCGNARLPSPPLLLATSVSILAAIFVPGCGSAVVWDDASFGSSSASASLEETALSSGGFFALDESKAVREQELFAGSPVSDQPASSSSETTSQLPGAALDVREDLELREFDGKDDDADFSSKVAVYLQFPEVGGGCEIAAMVSVLRAMGYDLTATDLSDNYLLKLPGEHDMVHGFLGNPSGQGAAYPPVMARAGNSFLRASGSEWRFVEEKGVLLSWLVKQAKEGRPVLVWSTMDLASAAHTSTSVDGYEWYSNEHCVVLYGESGEGKLLVMDPLAGMVEREKDTFEKVYRDCGMMSLVLSRDACERKAADEAELYLALSWEK